MLQKIEDLISEIRINRSKSKDTSSDAPKATPKYTKKWTER